MGSNTTTTTDLKALLARIEAAEGRSAELDALIVAALLAPEGATVERSHINGAWCIYAGTDHRGMQRLWEACPLPYTGRNVTASVDAALALVERMLPRHTIGLIDNQVNSRSCSLMQQTGSNKAPRWRAEHRVSLPLAICTALLKVLIAQEGET